MTHELTDTEYAIFSKKAKFYGECGPEWDVCAYSDPGKCGKYAMPFSGFIGMRHHDIAKLAEKYAAALHAQEAQHT